MKDHENIEIKIEKLSEKSFYISQALHIMKLYRCDKIELVKEAVDREIKSAKEELKTIQSNCQHKNTVREYHNDVRCLDCGDVW